MNDTVSVTTYQNLGSSKNLGLNLSLNFTSVKDLNISVNAQISHVWLKGTYNGQFYRNDGYTGNAFLNAGYKFGKGFRIGFDAGYFSGDVNLQGYTNAYFTIPIHSQNLLNKDLR